MEDVTAWSEKIDLAPVDVVRSAPAWMSGAERLMLYSLVYGLRPVRYVEIGTFQGGSALIVATAMDAAKTSGRLVCVDPAPQLFPEVWQRIQHRARLVTGPSPDVLAEAREAAEGPFDFGLIDADHSYGGVLRDAEGLLPFMGRGGHLVFHDSLNSEVGRAIDVFVRRRPGSVVDFGTLTREITVTRGSRGEALRWGGLRIVRCEKDG